MTSTGPRHKAPRRSADLGGALLVGCATAPAPGPAVAAHGPITVHLIVFNDLHGHLKGTGLTLSWPDPSDKAKMQRLSAGGAAHLAGLMQSLRAGVQHHLTLSGGDNRVGDLRVGG